MSPINFLGKTVQRWLAIAALLSAAAGAAVGMVLSGQVAGTISTALSQSLLVDSTNVTGLDDVYAGGTLTFNANPIDDDAVDIEDITYTFVDTFIGNAHEVMIGATAADSRDNLVAAVNRAAGDGTKYSTATPINPKVSAAAGTNSPVTLLVTHKAVGSGGNAIVIDQFLDDGQWGADTLTGGTGALKTAQFNAVSDDGTKFTAATEIMTGDGARINVVAVNRSTDTMGVLIRLDLLPGITGDIDGADDAGSTTSLGGSTGDSCVRVSLSEWKCKLAFNVPSAGGPGDGAADFKIKLALGDETPPGFYPTGVTMTQIENKR